MSNHINLFFRFGLMRTYEILVIGMYIKIHTFTKETFSKTFSILKEEIIKVLFRAGTEDLCNNIRAQQHISCRFHASH